MNTSKLTRRDFTGMMIAGSTGMMVSPVAFNAQDINSETENQLLKLSEKLLKEWCDGLLKHQITSIKSKGLYGGMICPACARIHGRIGDAIYPLMFMANKSGEKKYLESAKMLYAWTEENVSSEDGSIVNDVNVGLWKGITVNWVISLAEAIKNYGHLLDSQTRKKWTSRMQKGIEFVYSFIDYGRSNINYPLVTSYAMELAGEILNEEKYKTRAREFAHLALDYFTENSKILYGEGQPAKEKSPKGVYPIDLGYNLEESLPYLILYARLTNDLKIMDVVTESLKTHLHFYLPDGGLDNSFGTRNYKWTYWGTRTGDGAQPAFAMLADREPSFWKAAYKNLELMEYCTHEGLLHGGPHYVSHGVLPCLHHTFCHTKALATILDKNLPEYKNDISELTLPREKESGVTEISDVQSWLVSVGEWRATITGYDKFNSNAADGHATGGALSVLWSKTLGPVMIASNTNYQLIEPGNMQMDLDINSIPLTPRLEWSNGNTVFRNINDLKATIKWHKENDEIVFDCYANLVDSNQNLPPQGNIPTHIQYRFSENELSILIDSENPVSGLKFIFPVISTKDENAMATDKNNFFVHKANGRLEINSNEEIVLMETSNGRIFNYVPGMEAIPLNVKAENKTQITLKLV